MVTSSRKSANLLGASLGALTEAEVVARMSQDTETPLKPWIRAARKLSPTYTDSHWRTLTAHTGATEEHRDELYNEETKARMGHYANNIENFIGELRVPVGVIGPLRMNGAFAKGDYYAPLATTEAALVASYGRGARLISAAGGCSTAILGEAVQRSPGFAFTTLVEAGRFVNWVIENLDMLRTAAESTTRFGKLTDISPHMEGENVYLVCSYTTGDAAGQNMVTIATEALCTALLAACPITPRYWFVEANFSGDKKASHLSLSGTRGRKATATVDLPADLIAGHLHTTAERMDDYWRMSALGGVMSGGIGVQGHYANGLAALYLATGQDAACVAESAVGVTRMELRGGDLRVAVTMPNIIVGTVGGGTSLPGPAAGLAITNTQGAGQARILTELVAAVCLAGELSIIGALCAHDFASAHKKLARG